MRTILRAAAAFLLWLVLTAASVPAGEIGASFGLLVIGYAVFAVWLLFKAVPLAPVRTAAYREEKVEDPVR